MILCFPSQFFDFLAGFRPLVPANGLNLSYTHNWFQALLTPLLLIAATTISTGQGLSKRTFSIVERS